MTESGERRVESPETGAESVNENQGVIELKFPFDFEGKRVEKITLDYLKLNGGAMRRAEKQYQGRGGTPGVATLSDDYCICCATEAAGLPVELFDLVVGPDYQEVVLKIRCFLLGVASIESP
jgi:hypothetical protein